MVTRKPKEQLAVTDASPAHLNLEKAAEHISTEIERGRKIIMNVDHLSPEGQQALSELVTSNGWTGEVLWYSTK